MALVTVKRRSSIIPALENKDYEDGENNHPDTVEEAIENESVDGQQTSQEKVKRVTSLKKFRTGATTVRAALRFRSSESYLAIKGAVYRVPQPECLPSSDQIHRLGDLQGHVELIFDLLQPQDTIKMAIEVECSVADKKRYLVLVTTISRSDAEESVILGVDIRHDHCDLGLVMPLWSDMHITSLGDGGFNVTSGSHNHNFKPISVQTLWASLQGLYKVQETARHNNYYPNGLTHKWTKHYEQNLTHDQAVINDWNAMEDIESRLVEDSEDDDSKQLKKVLRQKLREIMTTVDLDEVTSKYLRERLEAEMGMSLVEHKQFISEEMVVILQQMDSPSHIFEFLYLGSEWNAANFDELQKNGVKSIVNVTREIDNFYPGQFVYHNIRVYDEETTDLLKHWEDAVRFISAAKQRGNILVHCKMGVSRSASTVIAFAMKEFAMSLDDALKHVKKRRSVVQPNPGFMKQLRIYEGILDASRHRKKTWKSSTSSTQSLDDGKRRKGDIDAVDDGAKTRDSDAESGSTVFSDTEDDDEEGLSEDAAAAAGDESVTLVDIRHLPDNHEHTETAPPEASNILPSDTDIVQNTTTDEKQSLKRRTSRQASYDIDMLVEERRRQSVTLGSDSSFDVGGRRVSARIHPDLLIEAIFRDQRDQLDAAASSKLRRDSSWINRSADGNDDEGRDRLSSPALALEPGLVGKTKQQFELKEPHFTRSQSLKSQQVPKKQPIVPRRRTLELKLTPSIESPAESELSPADEHSATDDDANISADPLVEEGSVRRRAKGFESMPTEGTPARESKIDSVVIRSGSVRQQRQEIESWGKGDDSHVALATQPGDNEGNVASAESANDDVSSNAVVSTEFVSCDEQQDIDKLSQQQQLSDVHGGELKDGNDNNVIVSTD